ncbi:MAG: hypothetical protein ACI9CU_002700, partial [Polaribacter sp.]
RLEKHFVFGACFACPSNHYCPCFLGRKVNPLEFIEKRS